MTKDEMIELGPEFVENYNRIRKMFPGENSIPYEVCLVSDRELTEEEYNYGKQVGEIYRKGVAKER